MLKEEKRKNTEEEKISDIRDEMRRALPDIGLAAEEKKLKQLQEFYRLLIETNRSMNLTAITKPKEVVYKHFIDSLSLVRACPDIKVRKYRVLDIGTGAGFPSIPLAIFYPDLEITALDSLNKRIKFIETVKDKLGLDHLHPLHARAEDLAKEKDYREGFDLVVSRAVANLSTLAEYSLPFVKQGGAFVSYKSDKSDEELKKAEKAILLLGGEVEKKYSFSLSDENIERKLIVIRKKRQTAQKYPRKAGIPAKEPLS